MPTPIASPSLLVQTCKPIAAPANFFFIKDIPSIQPNFGTMELAWLVKEFGQLDHKQKRPPRCPVRRRRRRTGQRGSVGRWIGGVASLSN
jgi:hypothetical protein